MTRTILIVDDSELERAVLKGQLQEEYQIIEAVNGKEALSILDEKYQFISAIILDIEMPVMDGYEVLEQIRASALYFTIPVIVITAKLDIPTRERALAMGANGILTKPHNFPLMQKCLQNVISMREYAALANSLSKDKLTGLLNRDLFFDECDKRIRSHEPGYYIMSCLDIDNFKVINDQYGMGVGDEVLVHVARCINSCVEKIHGLACRFSADRFAVFYPKEYMDSDIIMDNHRAATSPDCIARAIRIRIGRYKIRDCSIHANIMFERATVAEESIKGRYDIYVAEYNDLMRASLLHEQQIVNDMERALERGEFIPFLQPQYNHATGALIGAEALVRWKKEDYYISPGEFIPIFERNGFVYEVDKCIWEQVCKLLRKWLDEKKKPLPISVNISRFDLYKKDFFSVICGLVKQYKLPTSLLRLEVTESAFADSPRQLLQMVNQLIQYGFTVEIDDFGSGYSSLNTLKDVEASILKLDMKFFENTENSERSGNIVESVVRMAKWLGMAVIAEGVEDKAQADFLKSIGCFYIQGYYYAKPMTVTEYEKLLKESEKEHKLTRLKALATLNNNEFWNPKSMETLIFNSYVGGACIFEYYKGETELLRVNDQYTRELGSIMPDDATLLQMSPVNYLDEKNKEILNVTIRKTIITQRENSCELKLRNETCTEYIRYTMREIASTGERYLFYCVMVNKTKQRIAEQKRREAERKEMESAKQLNVVMRNINGGVSAILIHEDASSEFVFNNERYYELYGYTKEQAMQANLDVMTLILPEDLDDVMAKVQQLKKDKKPSVIDYRCRRRDGEVVYLRANSSLMSMEGYGDEVITSVVTDITKQKLLSEQLQAIVNNINGGVTATILKEGAPEFIIVNHRYFDILGYTKEQYEKECEDKYKPLFPEDRERVIQTFEEASKQGGKYTMEYRVIRRDGTLRWVRCNVSVMRIFGIDEPVQLCVTNDVTEIKEANERVGKRKQELLDNLPCGAALYQYDGTQIEVIHINKRYWKLIKREPVDYTDASVLDAVYKDDVDVVKKEIDNAIAQNRDVSCYIRIRYGESGFRPFHVMGYVEKLQDGIYTLYSTYTPITNQDMSFQEILPAVLSSMDAADDVTDVREKESMLKLLTSSIPGGLATFSVQHGVLQALYFNEGFYRFSGYSREEYTKMTDENPLAIMFEEDRPKIYKMIQEFEQTQSDGDIRSCTYRTYTKDGGFRWMSLRSKLTRISDDRYVLNVVQLDITEQKEIEESLRMMEEEYRLATLHSGRTIGQYDVQKQVLTIAAEDAKRLAISECLEGVPYERVKSGEISRETSNAYIQFFEDIQRGEKEGVVMFQKHLPKGWRWINAHSTTIYSSEGQPVSALISYIDITEEYEKEAIYKKWQQSIDNRQEESFTLFRCNLSQDASFDSSEGKLIHFPYIEGKVMAFDECSRRYAEENVFSEDVEQYLTTIMEDRLIADYHRGKRHTVLEYREMVTSYDVRWIRRTIDVVERPDETGIMAYLLFEDIDEWKREELATHTLAEIDSLTGVLNRKAFTDKFNQLLEQRKENSIYAFLLLDMDGFKKVNDTYGHATGDQVLIETGKMIRSALLGQDFVGRLGGDEFMVALCDVAGRDAVEKKARRIWMLTHREVGGEVHISSSIGIALCPRDGEDFDTLYAKADKALYFVKEHGKDNYGWYEE